VYTAALRPERIDLATLHRWLAHIALDTIRKMISSGALEGVELTDDGPMATCEMCKQAKATRKQIRKECEACSQTWLARKHTRTFGDLLLHPVWAG